MNKDRREFLADVGRGMLIASVGPSLAADLGLAIAHAEEPPRSTTPAHLEPLVSLMQETPLGKLQPLLVEKLKAGIDLRTLVAAGAVANARKYDYNEEGSDFHAFMALAPAWEMSRELPEDRRALPVLKVLYWNTEVLLACRARPNLPAIKPATLPAGRDGGELLREATRKNDVTQAESTLAALTQRPPADAFQDMQPMLQDGADVHRVVLAWRAWSTLDLTGRDHANTLLRQSVRWCLGGPGDLKRGVPVVLPKLLDQYKLLSKPLGQRQPDDAWVDKFSLTIYGSSADQAAEAVAAALAEGMAPEAIGEAISLAANRRLLSDPGSGSGNIKRKGSVHGNSHGVHASDAANAWRNIARVSNPRNAIASLILASYSGTGRKGREPFPSPEHLKKVRAKDAATLLQETEAAIRSNDQGLACACVQRYGELGHAPRPVFDLMLKYAVSEDGEHHAEKYYRTVTEEFATIRPAFRWRELVGLARVTASACGDPTPGYAEACRLLQA